jgi:cob(I)alamin adenosyltransferase
MTKPEEIKADETIKGFQGYGLVQVITGHGKGKTTSSLGLSIRAAGADKKVGIIYFDKGGDTHYSERKILDEIGQIDYVVTGRDRIDKNGRFDFSITDVDKSEGQRGLVGVREMFEKGYDLIVLDEINSSADLGIVSVKDVLRLIEDKPEQLELVLTGRDVHADIVDKAHLVTEMKLKKHYFYSGVKAREGIDY